MIPRPLIGLVFLLIVTASMGSGVLGAGYGVSREEHLGDLDKPVQKKLDLMSKKLDLSPNQGFSVKTALEDQATKLDMLNKEYVEAKTKIADETNGVLMGILNPQQQDAYQKIKPDILGNADTPPLEGPRRSTGRSGYRDDN